MTPVCSVGKPGWIPSASRSDQPIAMAGDAFFPTDDLFVGLGLRMLPGCIGTRAGTRDPAVA